MPAPRDSDLAVYTYHRHPIVYAGAAPALAGTAVTYDRVPAVNGGLIFGVLESDAAPGETVSIAIAGICQMITGSSIGIGAAIGVDASSRALSVSPGNQLFGRSLSQSSASGQKIQVLITREGTN